MRHLLVTSWICVASIAFADPDGELAYRQEAIHFGSMTTLHVRTSTSATGVTTTAGTTTELRIYQGEMNRRLSAEELVRLTERNDIIRAMEAKQRRAKIIGITGVALVVAAIPLAFVAVDRESSTIGIVSAVTGGTGLFLGYVGANGVRAETMFSDRTLYDLGAEYNRKLRARHGLAITPYAREDGAGVIAAGHF